MAKLDKFFEERDAEDYPTAIQKVNVMVYDTVEAQKEKSGGGKVTIEIMKMMKKCFDYINIRLVRAHRESVANETKVRTMVTNSRAYEALVKRVSGGTAEESKLIEFPALKKVPAKKDHGFSVMISPVEGDDIAGMKKELKGIWKEKSIELTPYDVVSTKSGQLVMRVKTKEETEKLRTLIEGEERLKGKVKITVPKRRRQRILILSVDVDVTEDEVKTSLVRVLEDGGLSASADVDVVRHYPTRRGSVNWIIDVDADGADLLIARRRLCIALERYRMVGFVPVVRCFKCQAYGHMTMRCPGPEKCVRCSGAHGIKDCKETEEKCANCANRDDDIDIAHRADSMDCPCYQEYRTELLSKRL